MRRTHLIPLSAAFLLIAGCHASLKSDLDEVQADEVILALHEAGIGADKALEGGAASEPRYRVEVSREDVGRALAVLQARELPRLPAAGLGELFAESSLLPTATEERARYVAAVAGELTRTLESIDGVVDARVHLAVPERGSLLLDGEAPEPRASVLLRHRAGSRAPDDAAVRALVAGAILDIPEERVAVVRLEVPDSAARAPSLVEVGPVTVTASTATRLRLLLATGLVILMGLALTLVWAVRRGSGRRVVRAASS